MPVLLTILKIIGIILLCIIGLVLLLVLMVLFVPIRYRIKADNKDKINGMFSVTYLLHIISVKAIYKEGLDFSIRVFGIPIKKKKGKDSPENDADTFLDNNADSNVVKDTEAVADTEADCDIKDNADSVADLVLDQEKDSEAFNETPDEAEADSCESEPQKKGIFARLKSTYHKIKSVISSIPDKISDTFTKLEDKILGLFDTIEYYNNLFSKRGTEYVIELVKTSIIKIFKHIRPRRSRLKVRYGDEDPSKAGKFYSIYGMAMPFLPKHTDVDIIFDEKVFEFSADLKGRIIPFRLMVIGLKLMFDKKVKKFLKLLKREDKNNGR